MEMTVDVSYVMSMTTWETVMSKLQMFPMCFNFMCVFFHLIMLILSEFYDINNTVLCLFWHKFML
jgi:hypothetical protein